MAYMDLIRGLHDGERIEYPIFEMELLSGFTVGLVSTSGSTWQPFLSVVYANNADISAAFPDGIPTTVESDGVVCQNDYKYVSGSPAWTLKTQAFSGLAPTATPPDDWSTNFFDYYTASTRTVGGNTFAVFTNVAAGALSYQNSPPAWNPNTSYYHDDLPLQQRAAHIFTTDSGWTFGVNISPNWQYGYIRAVANCNPEHALVGIDDVFCIHDPSGNQYGGYIPSDTLAPYQLQTGFISSIPFLQIFVHCIYNEVDYYGIAQILMSGTSESAHPIGIRMLAFPTECYGDSIKSGDIPESGNWGQDSTFGGGDGTFNFDSQDHGDIDNNSISLVRSEINTAFSNLATGIHAYQLDANAMEKIVAVLYSSDYLTRIDAGNYNPLSCVLSYHLLPSQFRNFDTGTRDVVAGGYNFTDDPPSEYRVPAQKICLHTQEVRFTKKIIGKHFGAFPDFAPYTQAIMHLPYVGIIELDVNAFMYGEISVAYLCDCYTGNVAAYVTCKDHMNHVTQKYVGTGNCAYSLPIFSENQSAQTLGRTLVSTGTSVASTVAALNMGSPFLSNERMLKGRIARYGVGSALESGGSLAEMAILGIPKVPEIHGEFGGNVGLVADDTVWMEIIRPIWSNPSEYQALNGIPSNTSTKLSECTGFTQVTSIEIEGCTATTEEIEELKSILESGIIIRNV